MAQNTKSSSRTASSAHGRNTDKFWTYAFISYAVFTVIYIGFCMFMIQGNRYSHLSYDMVMTLGVAFLFVSIPLWVMLATVWTFKAKKHFAFRILGCLFTLVLFFTILPQGVIGAFLNLSSVTEDPSHYLEFDDGVALSEQAETLFPDVLPADSSNVKYYYAFCPLMKDMVLVQLSIDYQEESYATEKQRLLTAMEDAKKNPPEESGEVVLTIGNSLAISYTDATHTLEYIYSKGPQ